MKHVSSINDNGNRLQHKHDWDNIKILDKESCYNKRLISEMLNIEKQKTI